MPIDAKDVARLREETGAAMMDCKRALDETKGDFVKAKDVIRKKGLEKADMIAQKGGTEVKEGRIGSYIHSTGKIAAMVELTCQTDFVAKGDDFVELLREFAVAVAAFNPLVVSKDQLPPALVEEEKAKYANDVKGKPPEIAAKILDGKMEKNLFSQKCLLSMTYPKEEKFKGTYGDYLKSKVALIKENIVLRRFVRMEVGG